LLRFNRKFRSLRQNLIYPFYIMQSFSLDLIYPF